MALTTYFYTSHFILLNFKKLIFLPRNTNTTTSFYKGKIEQGQHLLCLTQPQLYNGGERKFAN